MAFKEQDSTFTHQIIDGNKVPVITPEVWATVTNTLTGKEYGSDAEAEADVENPATETKKEYTEDNQRQINRALTNIIEQLNSTYLTQLKENSERYTWFGLG